MLKINNIKVVVEEKPIIKGITLSIDSGEVVAVMGPNGSGKSTLAYALAGHPKYIVKFQDTNSKKQTVSKSKNSNLNHNYGIWLDGDDLTKLSPDKRAEKGLFLASQYPVAIPGLTINSFLWQIFKKRSQSSEVRGQKKMSVVEFRLWLEKLAKSLGIGPDLLKRGLNDGFSGGERKKIEILQMLVFNPKYVILDEIDSGLDVDALNVIAKTVAAEVKGKKMGVLVITHYNRILKYLKPDRVVVMEDGKIAMEGDGRLAEEIEEAGYQSDETK